MRLIDVDLLKEALHMGDECEECEQDTRQCQYDAIFSRMDICSMLDGALTVGGWISVEDRLPEPEEQVLIYYEWVGRSGGKYREIAFDSFKAMRFLGYKPLFWMPLPEPPVES